ncbi:MAG: hypothetical protein RSC49_01395, partial [Clostridium sp.]
YLGGVMVRIWALFKFYIKDIYKKVINLWIGVALVTVNLYGYYLDDSRVDTFRAYLDISYKYLLPIMCLMVYIIFINRVEEDKDSYKAAVYEKAILKIVVVKITALSLALIQIIIMVVHYFVFSGFTYRYLMLIGVEILIEYGVFLTLSGVISVFLSYYVNKRVNFIISFVYLGVIYCFTKYESIFFSNYFISKIDGVFIFNKVIIILFIGLLLLTIIYTKHKRDIKYIYFIIAILIFMGLFIFRYIDLYPKLSDRQASNTIKNYVVIDAYNMNIKLCENFQNNCYIKIKNTSKSPMSTVDVMLSNTFKVGSIVSYKEKLEFTHKNNLVRIKLNKPIKPMESRVVEIVYGGDINIFNSEKGLAAYSRLNGTYLNSNTIHWFPSSMDRERKTFKVKVNKPVFNNSLKLSKEFLHEGGNLFILQGNIAEKNIDSVNVVAPIEYITSSKNRYSSHMDNLGGRKSIFLVPSLLNRENIKLNSNNYFININSINQ